MYQLTPINIQETLALKLAGLSDDSLRSFVPLVAALD
jgi:hypothetical protein